MRPPLRAAAVAGMALAAACPAPARDAPPPPGGWDFWPWAETSVVRGQVTLAGSLADAGPGRREARLAVENAGPDWAIVHYGACSYGLRLYRDSALAAPPVWDDRPRPAAGTAYGCPAVLHELVVPPGETRQLASRPLDLGALRRAVPAGRYHVALTLRWGPRDPPRAVRAGAVTVGRGADLRD